MHLFNFPLALAGHLLAPRKLVFADFWVAAVIAILHLDLEGFPPYIWAGGARTELGDGSRKLISLHIDGNVEEVTFGAFCHGMLGL